MGYGVAGLVLPWNQLSYRIAALLLDVTFAVPVLGDRLAALALVPGLARGSDTR